MTEGEREAVRQALRDVLAMIDDLIAGVRERPGYWRVPQDYVWDGPQRDWSDYDLLRLRANITQAFGSLAPRKMPPKT